jgi:MFS family permease
MGDENSWRSRRLLSYGLLSIVVTHIMVHAGNIGSPIFPILKMEFNLTNQQIGLISAIPLFCQLLISIPAGVLSDRYGAKKLIALSVAMGAAGAFLASVSVNPWMYIVAMTLLTLNTTIYHPSAISHTAGMVSPSDRSRVMGIFNGGGTFGVSLGPLSVTILMGAFALSWRQTYQFWVLPILLSLVSLLLLKTGPWASAETAHEPDPEPDEATSLLTRNMAMYLTSAGVRRFGGSMTTGFLSIWLVETQGWDVSTVGLMFGLSLLIFS